MTHVFSGGNQTNESTLDDGNSKGIGPKYSQTGDLVVQVVFLVVGVLVARQGFDIGLSAERGSLGAGMVPAVVGSVMAILAGTLLAISGKRRLEVRRRSAATNAVDSHDGVGAEGAASTSASSSDNATGEPTDAMWKRWVNVAGLIALALVIPVVGLAPAVGIYVFLVSFLIERWKIVYSLLFAVAIGGAVWLIFQELLSVPVPTGFLG
ncbi:tripartite tricarboxylate transporter TctB family protein [Georgenia sp. Z1344]|uniref:tripartite tricarboxylate transporter TctB family protein n=1 Tax=Georgenia sp. Z1344 TaxID=3416706 RepID=UPI003CE8176B